MLRTYATVNLTALAHNLSIIRQHIPSTCEILAVVKANAYGHGAVDTAAALGRLGVTRLAVASIDEGIALRQAGITSQIIVLGALFNEQVHDVVANRLVPVISDERIVPVLAKAVGSAAVPYPVHVKIETGMGRLGLPPSRAVALFDQPELRGPLRVEGLLTHLADADGETVEFTERQLATFESTVERIRADGWTIPLVHAANSAALVRIPRSHGSLVRPGIMLYGYHTLPQSVPPPTLSPVLSLHTAIAQIRTIEAGGTVSYNRTFVAAKQTRAAVLPIGYADGYNRRLSNRGMVLIQGRRVPVIGLVCMDMIMVDVTDVSSAQVGDEAVLIGRQGAETIWADEMAGWMDTIPYEVLCAIGPRVPRVYRGS